MKILCSISTKGRYDTTLPLTIQSVITQTVLPDKLILFDDNDNPKDLREIQHYHYLFEMMDLKGLKWEVLFGAKKGQHYNHQIANTMGYDWVWRLDDDTVAEPDVLGNLISHINPKLGSVGGSILTPPNIYQIQATGKIVDIYTENNLQWGLIENKKQVEHLHCSFLYRAGVVDYCLSLSKVAHREETLFTYELIKKGYENYVIPNTITWHLKNRVGGIRDGVNEMFENDERIFQNFMKYKNQTIVVLDCGMGDHIVFSHVLPHIKRPEVFSCYPDIIPGRSIGEAIELFGDLDQFNIYKKMDQWNWKESLEKAFRKMYNV